MAKKNSVAFQALKEKERQARRKIIIDAAERVFTSIPFHEVTIRKIAKEASISPTTIYIYFHDQEELFVEICQRRGKDTQEMSNRIISEFDEDVVRETAFAYLDYFTKHHTYFRMIAQFMLYGELRPDSLEKLSTLQRGILDNLEAALKKGKVKGNTRTLAHVFFAELNGILVNCPVYPGRSGEEVKRHMRRLASEISDLFYARGV